MANINISQIRMKRGNTAASGSYIGPLGELLVDTGLQTIRIQDGVTAGGMSTLATQDYVGTMVANAAVGNIDLSSYATQANLTAFSTYANVTFGTSSYGNSNVAAYLVANPQGSTYSNVNVQAYLGANVGAFHTYANLTFSTVANAGTQQTQINSINANVTAANSAITTANTSMKSYVDAVTTAWTANAGTQQTQINSINANVTAANTKIATLQTQLYSNVNTAAYLAGSVTTGNLTPGNLTVAQDAVILGNLRVQGTQTTVNASTLSVEDLWITVANAAVTASDANGAGLRIDGAMANIAYSSITDSFEFNKPIVANVTTGNVVFSDSTYQTTAYTGPDNQLVNGVHTATLDSTGNLTVTGDILPAVDNTQDLGSATQRFRHLYVGPGTVYVGNAAIKTTATGNLILPGLTRAIASTAYAEEVEEEDDQTQTFTTIPTVIDNAYYSYLNGNPNSLAFTTAEYSVNQLDGDGYIDGINVDVPGSGYADTVARLAEQDMWATEAADPINNFNAGDWVRIPFRVQSRAGESEYEFNQGGGTNLYDIRIEDSNIGSDSSQNFVNLDADGEGWMRLGTYGNEKLQLITGYDDDNNVWEFGTNGSITFPDNTVQTTAYTGGGADTGYITFTNDQIGSTSNVVNITASEYAQLQSNDSYVWVDSTGAFIQLGSKTFEFDNRGILRLPSEGDIIDSSGQSVLGGGTADLGNLEIDGTMISTDGSTGVDSYFAFTAYSSEYAEDPDIMALGTNNGKDVYITTDGGQTNFKFYSNSGLGFPDGTVQTTAYAGGNVTVAPVTVGNVAEGTEGALWYNTEDGRTYVYALDTWIDANPGVVPGNMVGYGVDGNITLNEDARINYANGASIINSVYGDSQVASFLDAYTGNIAKIGSTPLNITAASVRLNSDNETWSFNNDGVITFPDGTRQATAAADLSNFAGNITKPGAGDGYEFSANVAGITIVNDAVYVTLDQDLFGGPDEGLVTIAGVAGMTEANGTWGYVAVEVRDIQLYTTFPLNTVVTGAGWGTYTSGGTAVSLGANPLVISADSITLSTVNNNNYRFDNQGITFPDGSEQITAYTGGAGGNVDLSNYTSGNVYINRENTGLIVDAADDKRVGFMKYDGIEGSFVHASGATKSVPFRIGRVAADDITQANLSVFTTEVFISNIGKVGINTTTPAYDLDVGGNVGVSGALLIGDNTTISNNGEFRIWADNDITVYRNGQDGYGIKSGNVETYSDNTLRTVINSNGLEIKTGNLVIPTDGGILYANGTNILGSIPSTGNITFNGSEIITSDNSITLRVPNEIPTGVANWNGQGGWNQGFYGNLATTGGTGTGLTVDVVGGGGYIDIEAITINNPGTGYTDGDVITIDNENNLPGTFTVTVPTRNWNFSANGATTFPDRGAVTITGDLTVGNLIVNGNTTTINTESYTVVDNIIQMATDNPADTLDLGFVAHRTVGSTLEHTGLVRSASIGKWSLFSNVVPQPGSTIDLTNAILDDLLVGTVQGTDFKFANGTSILSTVPSIDSYRGNITAGNLRVLNTYAPVAATGNIGDLHGQIRVDSNHLYVTTGAYGQQTYVVKALFDHVFGTQYFIALAKGTYPKPENGWEITRDGWGMYFSLDADPVDRGTHWWCSLAAYGGTYPAWAAGDEVYLRGTTSSVWKSIPLSTIRTPAYSDGNVETYIGANIGAFQTYANLTFGTSTYSNTNVADYLTTATITTTGNVTAANIITAGATSGNISGANYISANAFQVSTGIFWANGTAWSSAGGGTTYSSTGAGNITIVGSAINLTAAGPGAVATGSSTAIPVVTTDAYGRISSITTAAVVAPAGTLSGSTLNATVTASSLTSVGTLATLAVTGNVTAANIVTTGTYGNITGANVISANTVTVTTYVRTQPVTFAALPSASVAGAGARAFITDGNTATFGSQVSGSGANAVPVYSNGTNWYVG